MKWKVNQRRLPSEINPGSMADIGFLLLIFFLVSTTIKTDQGLLVKLPPIDETTQPPVVADRNICRILVNKDNVCLVRNNPMEVDDLASYLKEFILNPFSNPTFPSSPNKAIVSLQNDRATSYATYIQVYNEIKSAYNQLRDEDAMQSYGRLFSECNRTIQKEITTKIPMIISEAEPVDFGDDN